MQTLLSDRLQMPQRLYTKDEKMSQFHQAATTSDGTQNFWKQFCGTPRAFGQGMMSCSWRVVALQTLLQPRKETGYNICQLDPETVNNEEEEEDRIGAELHELRCDAVIGEIFGHNRLRS